MENRLTLEKCWADGRRESGGVTVRAAIIAGWTGRDRDALEAHISELEELGVARPGAMPVFYRVSAGLLTTAPDVEVLGGDTSGEVEAVLYIMEDGLWVGVGSDHTDRVAEARLGVAASKQLCPKPVSPEIWRYDEVREHWDEITLRSYVTTGEGRRLYQEGKVSAMFAPTDLVEKYTETEAPPPVGTAMFCGTFAVDGGPEPSQSFEMEMEDPVLERTLCHGYSVHSLPLVE